jgi:hypothetical protein
MVVLRWPERSRWTDTVEGVDCGNLIVGRIYKVVAVEDHYDYGPSVHLETGPFRTWGLGNDAIEHYVVRKPVVRRLPAWF